MHPTSSDITKHLRCLTGQRRTSRRKAAQDTERWFHQEFVQDLRRIGEFRVFIVTVSDESATRGRKGVVVEVVHTLELEDRELVVNVLPSSPAWPGGDTTYNKVDVYELKRFALHVFHALRDRPDWDTNFESLEIGARLDPQPDAGRPIRLVVADGQPPHGDPPRREGAVRRAIA